MNAYNILRLGCNRLLKIIKCNFSITNFYWLVRRYNCSVSRIRLITSWASERERGFLKRIAVNWKYLVAWLPGIPIAIANGELRDSWYGHFINELSAHQISTASFIIIFGIYVWFILRWLKLSSPHDALQVGFTWLILTTLFEFIFGHYVMGNSWERLFQDDNLFAGRLWGLVLVWITLSPLIFYRLQRKSNSSA